MARPGGAGTWIPAGYSRCPGPGAICYLAHFLLTYVGARCPTFWQDPAPTQAWFQVTVIPNLTLITSTIHSHPHGSLLTFSHVGQFTIGGKEVLLIPKRQARNDAKMSVLSYSVSNGHPLPDSTKNYIALRSQ